VTREINTWGEWLLAWAGGARMVAGLGLGALNALAAGFLRGLGFEEVTASVEADAGKLEALLARAPLPCSLVVYGRPSLMISRAELPAEVARATCLEDRFGARMRAGRGGQLWELRPVEPFDLRTSLLPEGAAHLVVDLIGAPDPVAEWERGFEGASRFNYGRVLV